MEKKGQAGMGAFGLLTSGVLALVVLFVLVVFGIDFMTNLSSNYAANSAASNAVADGITSLSRVTDQGPTIASAIVFVGIIGLIGLIGYGVYRGASR